MEERRIHQMESEEEHAPLSIPLSKLCYLIVKARQFDAKVPADDGESASNPTDDMAASVLEDRAEDSTLEELTGALDGLNDDEKIEVLALVWLGRGDYEATEWAATLAAAAERHNRRETGYLLGIPQLGDLIEDGMALLGYSCEDYEINRL